MRIRKSSERFETLGSDELAAIDVILQRAMPIERKSAEWGYVPLKALSKELLSYCSLICTSNIVNFGCMSFVPFLRALCGAESNSYYIKIGGSEVQPWLHDYLSSCSDEYESVEWCQ